MSYEQEHQTLEIGEGLKNIINFSMVPLVVLKQALTKSTQVKSKQNVVF